MISVTVKDRIMSAIFQLLSSHLSTKGFLLAFGRLQKISSVSNKCLWLTCVVQHDNLKKYLYLYDYAVASPAVWKMNRCLIHPRAPSSGEQRDFGRRTTLIVQYGYSLVIERTSVAVRPLLQCIYGIEWVHYLKGIGGDWRHSHNKDDGLTAVFKKKNVLDDCSNCKLKLKND